MLLPTMRALMERTTVSTSGNSGKIFPQGETERAGSPLSPPCAVRLRLGGLLDFQLYPTTIPFSPGGSKNAERHKRPLCWNLWAADRLPASLRLALQVHPRDYSSRPRPETLRRSWCDC